MDPGQGCDLAASGGQELGKCLCLFTPKLCFSCIDLPEGQTSHLQVPLNRGWAAGGYPGGPGPLQAPEFQSMVSARGRKGALGYFLPLLGSRDPLVLWGESERYGFNCPTWTDHMSLAGRSPAEDLFSGRRYDGGLDSGFHSVDSGSKRWSGNEVRIPCPRRWWDF